MAFSACLATFSAFILVFSHRALSPHDNFVEQDHVSSTVDFEQVVACS